MGTRTSIKLRQTSRDRLKRYKRRRGHDSYADAIDEALTLATTAAERTREELDATVADPQATAASDRLTTRLMLLVEDDLPDDVLTIEELPHIHDAAVACHLRHRAEQARDALRRGDADTAQDECERIITLATALV
jgi:hypothetical protein